MRPLTAIVLLLLATTSVSAATGYCTGRYVEKGPDWQEGLIQEGDVFEYWCELPGRVERYEGFDAEIRYSNAHVTERLLVPRTIPGTTVVIYP